MQFKGTVHRYGRDVDTDVIIPARYLTTSEPSELAKHCMEDLDADFVNKVQQGDIIVADENFGCGSSREHAPIAIKASGVDVVIAKSFARIFIATPLILVLLFWNALKRWMQSLMAMLFRLIPIQAPSRMKPREQNLLLSRSLLLLPILLSRAVC